MHTIKVKLLENDSIIPSRAHMGDLWDVYAAEDKEITEIPTVVSTGLALEIPEGYNIKLYNRSSNPLKNGLILSNGIGVIDTQYRGTLGCIFHCVPHVDKATGNILKTHTIHKGDKIAQIELCKLEDFAIDVVDTLSETDRGAGGFGSTGNK